ncbi:hypothetical protein [Cupriavidus basilensis]|uniref:hypothetical protein n=1 Tax=Cupriavidus basilensis TaxID=68895 RepID=UPI00157A5EDD|nr:hypothetical protein [Cupriavidus basilensis]NUA28437.1 EAL domain-containing protein [Cupriavidus basilensis]
MLRTRRQPVPSSGIARNARASRRTGISLGQRQHLELTAEGIENEVQAANLRQHGVHWAQCYLFAAPLAAGELAAWRHNHPRVTEAAPQTMPDPLPA